MYDVAFVTDDVKDKEVIDMEVIVQHVQSVRVWLASSDVDSMGGIRQQ